MDAARGGANTKYCVWVDTAAPSPCTVDPRVGRPYWAAVERAVERYLDALRVIPFPAEAKSDARTEMDAASLLVLRARGASEATTKSGYVERARAAQAASESESQTRQRLKASLGLPVGP